jgi:hypothetical protein
MYAKTPDRNPGLFRADLRRPYVPGSKTGSVLIVVSLDV